MTPKIKNGKLHLYAKPNDAERLIECFYDHLGARHPVVQRMIEQRDGEGFEIDGLAVEVEPTELQEAVNCLRMGNYTTQAIEIEGMIQGRLIGNGEVR